MLCGGDLGFSAAKTIDLEAVAARIKIATGKYRLAAISLTSRLEELGQGIAILKQNDRRLCTR